MTPRLPVPVRRVTQPRRRKAARLRSRTIEPALEILASFDEECLADLLARGEHSPRPDGYPSSSRASQRSSDTTSTTEAAAIALVDARTVPDPIGDAVAEFVACAKEVAGIVKRMKRLHSVVVNAADTVREPTMDVCQACGTEVAGTPQDRLRSGYCNRCYHEWRALPEGERDRLRFEASVREQLRAEVTA